MRAVPGAVAIISITLACSFTAAARAPELDMFVIPGASALGPGEAANITVYTFIDGERASFDGPVEASVVGGVYNVNVPLPVRSVSPGIYEFNYTMTASHADRYGYVDLVVRASSSAGIFQESGLSSAQEYITLSFRSGRGAAVPEGLRARARLLGISSALPAPGSRATFLCCITLDGEPAETGWVRFVMAHSPVDGEPANYTAEHTAVAPGVYLVSFTIPPLRHSDNFYLHGLVPGAERELYTGAWLSLDFFTVIYHELGTEAGLRSFELLVSDASGSPVRGAEVLLRASVIGPGPGEMELRLGPTDSKGRVRGTIPAPPVSDALYISGWANTSRLSQRFSGWMPLPGETALSVSSTSDFTVARISREPSLEPLPGESFRARYRAFSYGRPLASTALRCFVTSRSYAGSTLASSGVECVTVETDDGGGFSLNLTMPPGESSLITLYFKNPLPRPEGGVYSPGDYDFISSPQPAETRPPAIQTNLSRAHPGGRLGATVRAPGMDLLGVRAYLSLDGWEGGGGGGAWQSWSAIVWNLSGPDAEGAFSGTISLPGHLRPGTNATLRFIINNETGSIEHSADFRVQSPPSPAPETDVCCYAGLAAINIALILFLLGSFLAARRSAGRGAGGGEGLEARVQDIVEGAQREREDVLRRVALESSRECAVCGRRIARGNVALLCSCGKLFHEHCAGAGEACPVCGRNWKGEKMS